MSIYEKGMLCKHFKGSNLLEKNIYRIEELDVDGKTVDTGVITYTGVGVLEAADDLVIYSNVFQEGMLFAREYSDISAPLPEEKQRASGQVMRVQPLTDEEVAIVNSDDFAEQKLVVTTKKYFK